MKGSKSIHMIICLWKKALLFHNVIIHIKSVFNKDKNNDYYNIFSEKVSFELPKNNDNKEVFV